jgi:hypothetical protein
MNCNEQQEAIASSDTTLDGTLMDVSRFCDRILEFFLADTIT